MFYYVPMSGMTRENVKLIMKGRRLTATGKTPANSPSGPREVEAELLLPKPVGDKYDRGDFQLWWIKNEVMVHVLRYQNKLEALTFDDDTAWGGEKSRIKDEKADEMELEVVIEDDKK
ncbi:hypothetical protein R6Q59_029501 [Mikania micrantha]